MEGIIMEEGSNVLTGMGKLIIGESRKVSKSKNRELKSLANGSAGRSNLKSCLRLLMFDFQNFIDYVRY